MLNLYVVNGDDVRYVGAGNLNHALEVLNENVDLEEEESITFTKLDDNSVRNFMLTLDELEALEIMLKLLETDGFILDDGDIRAMTKHEAVINPEDTKKEEVAVTEEEWIKLALKITDNPQLAKMLYLSEGTVNYLKQVAENNREF